MHYFHRIFEKVRQYFGAQSESIPMSFVLGFYVSLIVKRWWEQYKLLPWPDTLALFISAGIPGAVSTIHTYIHCVCFLLLYFVFVSSYRFQDVLNMRTYVAGVQKFIVSKRRTDLIGICSFILMIYVKILIEAVHRVAKKMEGLLLFLLLLLFMNLCLRKRAIALANKFIQCEWL